LWASERVNDKEPVWAKRLTARLEVPEKGRSLMKAEVAEVKGADDIGLRGISHEHITL
jgi:hypothetical protein